MLVWSAGRGARGAATLRGVRRGRGGTETPINLASRHRMHRCKLCNQSMGLSMLCMTKSETAQYHAPLALWSCSCTVYTALLSDKTDTLGAWIHGCWNPSATTDLRPPTLALAAWRGSHAHTPACSDITDH